MAFVSLSLSDLQAGKPITQALMVQIKDNFDALNTTLGNDTQQDISGTQTIADQTVNGTFVITDTGSTFTLPVVANNSGIILRFVQQGNGASTIQGNGAENINGSNTYAINQQYGTVILYCDGDEWLAVAGTPKYSLYLEDGAEATPSYSFENEQTTGLYRAASGNVGFSIGGTRQFTFTNSVFQPVPTGIDLGATASPWDNGYINRVLLDDGTAASPALTFDDDEDTGLYRSSAGVTSWSSEGVLSGSLLSTGIRVVDGAEGSPSFAFLNEATTGLYLAAAGNVGFSIGGTRQFTFTTSVFQPVQTGIDLGATTVPWDNFYVNTILASDGAVSTPSIAFDDDADTGFYRTTTDAISWSGGGTNGGFLYSGGLRVASGSAAAPALSFLVDSNSGFYSFGADSIGVSLGGTTRITFQTTAMTFVSGYDIGSSSSPADNGYIDTILASDGLVGTPSFTFDGDSDTGFYRSSTGVIRWTGDGANGGFLYNGGLRVVNGTVSVPAISFINDGDTGLYWTSSGVMRWSGNGVNGGFLYNGGLRVADGSAAVPSMAFLNAATSGFYRSGTSIGVSISGTAEYLFGSTAFTALTTGVNDCGSSVVRWNNVYTEDVNATGTILTSGAFRDSSLTSTDPIATDGTGIIVAGTSDSRLKENVVDYTGGLDLVNSLRPVRFDWKAGTMKEEGKEGDIGFLAQEVEVLVPEAVGQRNQLGLEDCKTFSPQRLIPALVNAIQELKAEIEELKNPST